MPPGGLGIAVHTDVFINPMRGSHIGGSTGSGDAANPKKEKRGNFEKAAISDTSQSKKTAASGGSRSISSNAMQKLDFGPKTLSGDVSVDRNEKRIAFASVQPRSSRRHTEDNDSD